VVEFRTKHPVIVVESRQRALAKTKKPVVPRKTNPIPRQSLASAVLERLREKILSGELREGEQLRQDAIAIEFQISRIPVREALSHLAAEGLITIVANRGAVVSALSPDEIMQIFETRAALECYMLRCAIPNMQQEDFKKAEEVLERFEASLEKDSEVRSWGSWNWSFHSALYAPANRAYMLAYVKTLNINCDRYTRLHLLFTRDLHRAGQAHRELLDACKTRNPEIASAALWKHITEAGEYLKEFIQRHREQHS
jgi:DNA-binding GntR family transcriptional regulator